MNFRSRLLVAFLTAVLIPTVLLALFVRNEMTKRLTAQYERRVESLVEVIEEDLAHESEAIATSLAVLQRSILDDNRFRRAAVDHVQEERRYLLDYAGNAMRLTGLDMLQIQDGNGRIISSGHFRNEYDRLDPELPGLLTTAPGTTALVRVRAPDAPFVALARLQTFRMGGELFTIVAGVEVEESFLARLARGGDLTVSLIYPGGVLTSQAAGANADRSPASGVDSVISQEQKEKLSGHEIVRELTVPFVDSVRGDIEVARFRVAHRLDELRDLRRSVDRWFAVALAAAVVLSVVLASWLASRISRPLVELAGKTSRIDLDRLDIDFTTNRRDEIGALSRLLGKMMERLRASTVRIKDAERRATLGELARQVNHDIKNGLTPIRNVFRHLEQLAQDDPRRLADVFDERRGTLDSSFSYLEDLAANYARLYPRSTGGAGRRCDVNAVIRRVVGDLSDLEGKFELRANLGDRAVVHGDPLSLRRVIENLVKNAIDSLESGPGTVTVSTTLHAADAGSSVRITVADTGFGMSEEQRARAFDDFYTTKEDGTGLGLSIVRRLVMDLDGSVRVESEEGKGSRFVIELPAAGEA